MFRDMKFEKGVVDSTLPLASVLVNKDTLGKNYN